MLHNSTPQLLCLVWQVVSHLWSGTRSVMWRLLRGAAFTLADALVSPIMGSTPGPRQLAELVQVGMRWTMHNTGVNPLMPVWVLSVFRTCAE